MTDLAAEIAEFTRNVIAAPIKRDQLISEIVKMATHNSAWPMASYERWSAAIDEAVKRGLLQRTSETIWLPVVTEPPKPKQLGLSFD